jgi:hypothetical protein
MNFHESYILRHKRASNFFFQCIVFILCVLICCAHLKSSTYLNIQQRPSVRLFHHVSPKRRAVKNGLTGHMNLKKSEILWLTPTSLRQEIA